MQTSSKTINDFSAAMSGYFYQCWADFAPNGMVSVVQKIYSDGAQTNNLDMIDAIDAILCEIEGGKDFRELFPGVTGEYNPRADGMSVIEWLVLLKQYMEGNHSVFDHKNFKMIDDSIIIEEKLIEMSEIQRFRSSTKELTWIHPDTGFPGGYGREGSGQFHNELRDIIDNSSSIGDFNSGIERLRDRWQIDPDLLPDLPKSE